jgi:pyridoxal phosphate enzyme (YggS family)
MIQNLDSIRSQIPPHVRLIAVTKTMAAEVIREAYELGLRDFGENRLQEALEKQEQLQDLTDVTWHFIGHIQSNKAKKVVENFPWIHTCDSLKLARRLNRLATEAQIPPPKVCLQVKVLEDPNKYGWDIPQLWQDLPALDTCDALNIQGLMTILPLGLSDSEALVGFSTLKKLAQDIAQHPWSNLQMHELSMGMSADYPLAIQAGATMIRLGRILFGERNQ